MNGGRWGGGGGEEGGGNRTQRVRDGSVETATHTQGTQSWQHPEVFPGGPHPSTNRALRRLTSEVGRDPVHSTRYGRQRRCIHQ